MKICGNARKSNGAGRKAKDKTWPFAKAAKTFNLKEEKKTNRRDDEGAIPANLGKGREKSKFEEYIKF